MQRNQLLWHAAGASATPLRKEFVDEENGILRVERKTYLRVLATTSTVDAVLTDVI
jgi:hypothetical protein